MSEKIAMTPPDLNGDQIFWDYIEEGGSGLYLPPDTGNRSEVLDILHLPPDLIRLEEWIGEGNIEECFDSGVVYRIGDYAVKVMPTIPNWRALSCLRSNVILQELLLKSDLKESQLDVGDGVLRDLKTPQYLGIKSIGDPSSLLQSVSILVMSDESINRYHPDANIFGDFCYELRKIVRELRYKIYPEATIGFHEDYNPGNIYIGKDDVVLLDMNGCVWPNEY